MHKKSCKGRKTSPKTLTAAHSRVSKAEQRLKVAKKALVKVKSRINKCGSTYLSSQDVVRLRSLVALK